MTASDAPPGTQAEHHVRIDWHEPGSRVAYDLNGDIDGEWTGPRIRLPAIDAWWARGAGPPDAGRMPGLAGETVVIHADGERQVYVLKDWHPGREFPGVASDGYFDAEWPDLPPLLLAVHLVPGCPQRLRRGKGNRRLGGGRFPASFRGPLVAAAGVGVDLVPPRRRLRARDAAVCGAGADQAVTVRLAALRQVRAWAREAGTVSGHGKVGSVCLGGELSFLSRPVDPRFSTAADVQ